ncbi:unnamed protein product [Nesidiocoris tenuis]|uniref:Uncharacterized protein n=1 Tax=Nesidiocoris tenuis TaxID=355587 RepID=A0A6H5GRJ0_9HEMI|nr:unnamed protein product [Nesidiocoris tenuis]
MRGRLSSFQGPGDDTGTVERRTGRGDTADAVRNLGRKVTDPTETDRGIGPVALISGIIERALVPKGRQRLPGRATAAAAAADSTGSAAWRNVRAAAPQSRTTGAPTVRMAEPLGAGRFAKARRATAASIKILRSAMEGHWMRHFEEYKNRAVGS